MNIKVFESDERHEETFELEALTSSASNVDNTRPQRHQHKSQSPSPPNYWKLVALLSLSYIGVSSLVENPTVKNAFHGAFSTHNQSSNQHWVPNAHDFQYCSSSGINVVPSREEDAATSHDVRPFSLRPQDFQVHSDSLCTSVEETVSAIDKGQRVWDTPDPDTHNSTALWLDREKRPSTFVPDGCHVAWKSPADLCSILNQFSSTLFVGDSLVRHTQAGFITSLSNNFQSGFLSGSPNPITTKTCRCDGQWSENPTCRFTPVDNITTLQPGRFCNATAINFQQHWAGVSDGSTLKENLLNHPEWMGGCWQRAADGVTPRDTNKGLLLVLEGGLHNQVNAQVFIKEVVQPLFASSNLQMCAQLGRLYVIWQSIESESPSLDKIYPNQAPEHAREFNKVMREYMATISNNTIVTLNWMNFTRGAQTSDGLHMLMNVNYFKAQYLLSIAQQMKQEGRVTVLPH